jgi:hypothetical protein
VYQNPQKFKPAKCFPCNARKLFLERCAASEVVPQYPSRYFGLALLQKKLRWVSHGSEASSQSSGGKGTPQMFRGLSNSIPQCIGFSGSMWTTWALARLSVKYT